MMYWNNDGHMSGWGWVWMASWMLFIVLVTVAVIVFLVRSVGSGNGSRPVERESALEVLRRRYAAGELDDEEYERRRAKLLGH